MEKAQKDWSETGTLESRWHNYHNPLAAGPDATFIEKAKAFIELNEKYNLTGTAVETAVDRTNFIQHHIDRLKIDNSASKQLIAELEKKKEGARTSLRATGTGEQSSSAAHEGGGLIDYKINRVKQYLSGNITELDSIILDDLKK